MPSWPARSRRSTSARSRHALAFLEHGDDAGRAALNAEVTRQASVVAYANDFKLMMVVALAALPLIFLLKRAKAQPGETAILE